MRNKGLKVLALCLFLAIFLVSSAFAQNATSSTDAVDKAYECLENQITERSLSLKEATFGVLALGSKGDMVSRVEDDRSTDSCWPKGGCGIKESAQVALAYDRIGKDTSGVKEWLLKNNKTANELRWLLQIDITSKLDSSCIINDGQRDNTINVLENAKLQGNPGPCLSIDNNGYMLRINQNCLDNEFEISCDEDFVTSVLYQKTTGDTLFILPDAHSAASLGKTEEKVNSKCFRLESRCDYEGSLWAALALHKMGEDVSSYTPYLLAFADDNARYFPSSFLYILVGGEDHFNLVVQEQKQGKFWEIAGTRDGRYYDTSLAMMALADSGGAEVDAAKSYLLSIQTDDGCWNNNNIRDTAFLLYGGWPRGATAVSGGTTTPLCESPLSCENAFECTSAGGTIQYNYDCSNAGESCCSIALQDQTCGEKGGLLCGTGETCDGTIGSASDGPCCFGNSCLPTQEDTCTDNGGACRISCASDEEELFGETCTSSSEICCAEEEGGSALIWIILLLILIALVVLGIIYRDKVKLYWHGLNEKFKKKPAKQPPRPGARYPAPPGRPGLPQRPVMMQGRPMPMRPVRPVRGGIKDKEMSKK